MKWLIPFLLASTASAQSFDMPATLDVIEGWRTERGTHMAALRITLDDGWKTYWRAPGDTGIPPSFDLGASENLAGIALHWPSPEISYQNGVRSLGFSGQLILPIEVTPARDGAVRLAGVVQIGVCEDVCLPVTFDFDAVLPNGGTQSAAIATALMEAPVSARDADLRSATCRIKPIDGGAEVTAVLTLPRTAPQEIVVVETADPSIWSSEAVTSRSGDALTAVSKLYTADGGPLAIDRSGMRFTVVGHDGDATKVAVDIQGCTAG